MGTSGSTTSGGALRAPAAVLFDFGGTLDAPGVPWQTRMFELFRVEGCGITRDDFAPIFHRADDALVGTVPATLSFRATVVRLVEDVGAGLSFDDPGALRRVAESFIEGARASVLGHASLLSDLARRYRLGLVSNFYGNLTTVCEDLDLAPYLAVTVDSAVAGWTKPDPRLFRHALDQLTVDGADAVFVGDSLSRDMAGARDVGMQHVWLAGAHARHGAPCCPDDRVIGALDELRALLL